MAQTVSSDMSDDEIAAYVAHLESLEDAVDAAQLDKRKFFEACREGFGKDFVASLKLAVKTARMDPDKRMKAEAIDAGAERILAVMRKGLHLVARRAPAHISASRVPADQFDAETGEILEEGINLNASNGGTFGAETASEEITESTGSTEGRELNLAHQPGGFSVVSGTVPADSQGDTDGANNRVGDGAASPELMAPKPVLKPGPVDTNLPVDGNARQLAEPGQPQAVATAPVESVAGEISTTIPTPAGGGNTTEPDSGLDVGHEVAPADVGQRIDRQPPKLEAAGSSPAVSANHEAADRSEPEQSASAPVPRKGTAPDGNPNCQKLKRGEDCMFSHQGFSCADCNYIWAVERQNAKKRVAA